MTKEETIKTLLKVMTQDQIDSMIEFKRKTKLYPKWKYTGEVYKESDHIVMVWKCGRNRHWLDIAPDGTIRFQPVVMTGF